MSQGLLYDRSVIEPTHIVPYGRPATRALHTVIGAAKAGNPLAPVTVVVASNFVGLSARRLLGSSELDPAGGSRGIANVAFVTPFQLVELVGADLLLDTRPLTNPVLGAAVRRVLRDEPGPYERVRDHQATEAALGALFAELSNVDEVGLESIAELESTQARAAVSFHRAITRHLDGFHTEHDLATAAAERADLGERVASLGHVVWFLPAPVTPAVGRFLDRVLHEASGSSVVLGLTGVAEADEPVLRSAEAAGVVRPTTRALDAVARPATAGRIISVTDASEEVRVVAGRILELAAGDPSLGTGDPIPLHRIGIFYPSSDPYVRIIEQQLAASGIVANGPDPRRLRDSVAGRTLLAALALPGERWRRDRVMALVAGAPVGVGEFRSFPTTWDDLSREAGVVRDLSDWRAKLAVLRAGTEQRLTDLGSPSVDGADPRGSGSPWRRARLVDRLADIDRLGAFVDELHRQVAAVQAASSWSDTCSAAQALLVWLLGGEHRHSGWPEREQAAFERVEAALVRLSGLDPIEPTPSFEVFQRALRSELDVARGRHGRFGEGVLFGPLSSAVGHDLDAVFVLGAAEGLLPVPRRDDAVLPDDVRIASMERLRTQEARLSDDVRIASIDQLETKAMRLQHQHRAFLAALAAAPAGAATLVFPRGSLRSNRRTLPSRWLLDSASQLAGRPVYATDFDTLGADVVDTVGSFASGIRSAAVPASPDDRDLADLAAFVERGGRASDHPLAAEVRSGLTLQAARSGDRFTIFDGNLAGHTLPAGDTVPRSSTRLETWAACGFRYFLQYVLDLHDRDDPEHLDDITALERGSLLHGILETFIAEAIEAGPPEPGVDWSPEQRQRLHAIADSAFADLEARGRTGRALHWQVRQDDLREVLDRFLLADNAFRAANGATPTRVELAFGLHDRPAVEVTLASGRTLAFRGLADRVDVSIDGRAIVTDYKTGKGSKYDALKPQKGAVIDPVLEGTALQLGLYAEAAMHDTGLGNRRGQLLVARGACRQGVPRLPMGCRAPPTVRRGARGHHRRHRRRELPRRARRMEHLPPDQRGLCLLLLRHGVRPQPWRTGRCQGRRRRRHDPPQASHGRRRGRPMTGEDGVEPRVPVVVADAGERRRISADGLAETLFVEAGAGTGKTTQLVDRVVNLVLEHVDRAPLGDDTPPPVRLVDIAAITFTEAAAAELSTRIRVAFEKRAADPTSTAAERAACVAAIADSDQAAISTVHGFASRILNEFSIAAHLPPRITVLDEVSSQLAHEQRWERFVDRLYDDPDRAELLYRAALLDVALVPRYNGQASFKDVAANFAQNWDRIVELAAEPPGPARPDRLLGLRCGRRPRSPWSPSTAASIAPTGCSST